MSIKFNKTMIIIILLILLKIIIIVITYNHIFNKKIVNPVSNISKISKIQPNIQQNIINHEINVPNETEIYNIPTGRRINAIGQHVNLSPTNELKEKSLIYDDPKNILNLSTEENFQDDTMSLPMCSRDPLLK